MNSFELTTAAHIKAVSDFLGLVHKSQEIYKGFLSAAVTADRD